MKKSRLLTVALATLMLASCGANEPAPAATTVPATTSEASSAAHQWKYLGFMEDTKVRFDLFDLPEGLQISYGNEALTNGKITTLNDKSMLSVNKNLDHDTTLNTLIVAEKSDVDQAYIQGYLGTEGDSLDQFFDIVKNVLVGYQRAYISFSIGKPAKWTKGLNDKIDSYFGALVAEESGK